VPRGPIVAGNRLPLPQPTGWRVGRDGGEAVPVGTRQAVSAAQIAPPDFLGDPHSAVILAAQAGIGDTIAPGLVARLVGLDPTVAPPGPFGNTRGPVATNPKIRSRLESGLSDVVCRTGVDPKRSVRETPTRGCETPAWAAGLGPGEPENPDREHRGVGARPEPGL
jgi:hypothetical protein